MIPKKTLDSDNESYIKKAKNKDKYLLYLEENTTSLKIHPLDY